MADGLPRSYYVQDLTTAGIPPSQGVSLISDEQTYRFSPARYGFYMQLLNTLQTPEGKNVVDQLISTENQTRYTREQLEKKAEAIIKDVRYMHSAFKRGGTGGTGVDEVLDREENENESTQKRIGDMKEYVEYTKDEGATLQSQAVTYTGDRQLLDAWMADLKTAIPLVNSTANAFIDFLKKNNDALLNENENEDITNQYIQFNNKYMDAQTQFDKAHRIVTGILNSSQMHSDQSLSADKDSVNTDSRLEQDPSVYEDDPIQTGLQQYQPHQPLLDMQIGREDKNYQQYQSPQGHLAQPIITDVNEAIRQDAFMGNMQTVHNNLGNIASSSKPTYAYSPLGDTPQEFKKAIEEIGNITKSITGSALISAPSAAGVPPSSVVPTEGAKKDVQNNIDQHGGAVEHNKFKDFFDKINSTTTYGDREEQIARYEEDPVLGPSTESLTITDRVVFIATTFVLRALALFVIQWGLNTYMLRSFNQAFMWYFIVYVGLFVLWVLLVNTVDKDLVFRMLFYYVAADPNGYGRMIAHLCVLVVFLPIPFLVKTKEQDPSAEEFTFEKRRSIFRLLSMLTFFIWVVTSAIAFQY